MQPSVVQSSSINRKWTGIILFLIVTAAGLFWAKWQPYFQKVFVVAESHSIGKSILTGSAASIPAPSWQAAWGYSVSYFLAIWKAMLVATVLASLVQVLIPRDWIQRVLGKSGFVSTFRGGLLSLPGMMCTCCAAPIVVGLRKCSSSVGAAAAFWFGNTALNPAVLIFMFFVLGWEFTLLRFVLALVLVFGVSYLANRLAHNETVTVDEEFFAGPQSAKPVVGQSFFTKWLHTFGKLLFSISPLYIVTVLLLGAVRAWLFPAVGVEMANSFWLIVGMAIAGTLFVIPTAAEIPIMQAMIAMGLGNGPAAALMITLPVISLPSILIVRKAFPRKVLAFLVGSVVVLGIVSGLIGTLL
jgi:uncharacterized protein